MIGGNFEGWVWFAIIMPPFLVITAIIYFHAENRGESGMFWALFCGVLPGLGFLIYLSWVLIQHFYGRKKATETRPGVETPDMALSRQRLRGSGLEAGGSVELEDLIQQGRWDDAKTKARILLDDAEHLQDGPMIAQMMGYLDRIKKRKRG